MKGIDRAVFNARYTRLIGDSGSPIAKVPADSSHVLLLCASYIPYRGPTYQEHKLTFTLERIKH